MARESIMYLSLDEVVVHDERRAVDFEAVKKLAASIKEIGLQHPITVRSKQNEFLLVAGRHRLEACRSLGEERIQAMIVKMDDVDAELWEISENLHRSELSALQRAESIDRWRSLRAQKTADDKVLTNSTPGGSQPKEAGVRKTAEELGIDPAEVSRSKGIAGLTPAAKEAAADVGLDTSRSALIEASRAPSERQADVVREIAERRASKIDGDVKDRAAREVAEMISEHVPGEMWDALKANLYAAGANNIANALTNIIGQSIMDRRYA